MSWVIDSYKPLKYTKEEQKEFDKCNVRMMDSAGYIPLNVRMQRMLEQGYIAQFAVSEFDSTEYRQLYTGEDTTITPDMDYEDIQDVLVRRELLKREFLSRKQNEEVITDSKVVGEKKDSSIVDETKKE